MTCVSVIAGVALVVDGDFRRRFGVMCSTISLPGNSGAVAMYHRFSVISLCASARIGLRPVPSMVPSGDRFVTGRPGDGHFWCHDVLVWLGMTLFKWNTLIPLIKVSEDFVYCLTICGPCSVFRYYLLRHVLAMTNAKLDGSNVTDGTCSVSGVFALVVIGAPVAFALARRFAAFWHEGLPLLVAHIVSGINVFSLMKFLFSQANGCSLRHCDATGALPQRRCVRWSGVVNVFSSLLFGGIFGSAIDISALGSILVPVMNKGCDADYAVNAMVTCRLPESLSPVQPPFLRRPQAALSRFPSCFLPSGHSDVPLSTHRLSDCRASWLWREKFLLQNAGTALPMLSRASAAVTIVGGVLSRSLPLPNGPLVLSMRWWSRFWLYRSLSWDGFGCRDQFRARHRGDDPDRMCCASSTC